MAKPAVRQADDILFYRVFSGSIKRTLEPEKKLMLAILEDAVGCLDKYRHSCDSKGRGEYEAALNWIDNYERDWLFSFVNICETLGFEPGYIRNGILKWDKELKESAVPQKKFRKSKSRS